ncbi:MAG: peptidoglycan-binding protein [Dongiaceae bacterium]
MVVRAALVAAGLLLAAAPDVATAQVTANDLFNLGKEILELQRDQQQSPAPQPAEPPPPEPEPEAQAPAPAVPAYDRTQVAEAQELLGRLGYDAGPVDGVMGARTARAIKAFQQANGLAPTGRPDDTLLAALRAATMSAEPSVASGPSFDCARAGTSTERAICASDSLAGLDRQIADSFLRAQEAATAAEQDGLRQQQRLWLAQRNTCGADADCLRSSMTTRLSELDSAAQAADVLTAAGSSAAAVPSSIQAPAAAEAAAQFSLAADEHGLLTAGGLPVVAGERGILGDEQLAAASRFLDFVELGLDPGLIEANPVCWARMHLPQSELGKYLVVGGAALESANYAAMAGELVAWRGADEFEAGRSKEAFLADHAEALRAKAVAMPLEVMVIGKRELPPYDSQAGGFQLSGLEYFNQHGISLSVLATYLGVATVGPACSQESFYFFPPAARVPEVWTMDPTQAEQILKRLKNRTVYIAIALRFRTIPSAKMDDPNRPSNRIPVWSDVASFAIYEDSDLERPIERLDLPKGKEPILLSGLPEAAPAVDSGSFNEASLALLMLRDHGDVLDAGAWGRLMEHQARTDAAYYNRRLDRRTGAVAYESNPTAEYDDRYIPFFPNGLQAGYQTPFSEAQIAQYRDWAKLRAKSLPREFVLPARIESPSGKPIWLALPVVDSSDSSPPLQALLDQGYSADQILRLDVDPIGIRQFDAGYLAGPGKTRQPVLILANVASHYVPEFSAAEQQRITDELHSGWPVVEISVEAGPSALVAAGDASESLAVMAAPKRLTIRNADRTALLYEKSYGLESIDPNRLDSAAPAVTPPAGDALPLAAETVDLLMVKHLPETVTDKDYDQMLTARWQYEAAVPPEKGEPDWGRFFVPGKPAPSVEQRAALLPRFKDWTVQRAAALPERLRLTYRYVRLDDGSPISVQAPNTPQDGNPIHDSVMVQSCQAEAMSYPALAPACDYLQGVLENAPEIYPFGLGYGRAGPRLSCATVLADSNDPYCLAREAQFDRLSTSEVEPGFRDIFVYDKELFFPGSQSDLVSLTTSSPNMIVDIAIAGVRVDDEPLPKPMQEASRYYQAFRDGLGLDGSDWSDASLTHPGRHYVFEAELLSAKLVQGTTHEPIADLELREARILDLQALRLPDAQPALPDKASGPDIVGLRLGMTFDEADAIIRDHMSVGRVLVRDRARDTKAVAGDFEDFSSSRIYVAEDGSEFIMLYDEPPAASAVVLGITRQVNFPSGKVTAAAVMTNLREKYGQEDWTGTYGIGWGPGLRETTTNDSVQHQCMPSSGNRSAKDWLEADGAQTQWRPGSSFSVPVMTMYNNVSGRTCGAVLTMQFDAVNDPAAEDRLVLHLTDPNIYAKYAAQSRELIKSGTSSLGTGSGVPDLKL